MANDSLQKKRFQTIDNAIDIYRKPPIHTGERLIRGNLHHFPVSDMPSDSVPLFYFHESVF